MTGQDINKLCGVAPVCLSVLACIWVLGNVAGGAHSGGDEGLGFHVFWLLILAQIPFFIGTVLTADWHKHKAIAVRVGIQAAALVLAFSPVAYFRL